MRRRGDKQDKQQIHFWVFVSNIGRLCRICCRSPLAVPFQSFVKLIVRNHRSSSKSFLSPSPLLWHNGRPCVDFCDCFDAEYLLVLASGSVEHRENDSRLCVASMRSSRRTGEFHFYPRWTKAGNYRRPHLSIQSISPTKFCRYYHMNNLYLSGFLQEIYKLWSFTLFHSLGVNSGVFVAHTAVRIPLPCTDRITRLICCLMGVALLRMHDGANWMHFSFFTRTTTDVTVSKSAMIAV